MSPNEGSSKPPPLEDEAAEGKGEEEGEDGATAGAEEGAAPVVELEAPPPSFPKAILAAV